jgi:hypothetical protein
MERCLFTDCANAANPILTYNLVVVPDGLLLFLGFLRDDIFGCSSGRTTVG